MLEANDPCKGADVEDSARPLLPHDRKDRAHDVHHAVEIGRDMLLDFDGAQLLEIAKQAVAGVVDHDVDAPVHLHRLIDRCLRPRFMDDVQLDERKVLACDIAQSITELVEIAAGRNYSIACLQGRPGRCSADSAARTRDEPDLAHAELPFSMTGR